MEKRDDMKELADLIRLQIVGVGGWLVIDHGGLFAAPVPPTVEEWTRRYFANGLDTRAEGDALVDL